MGIFMKIAYFCSVVFGNVGGVVTIVESVCKMRDKKGKVSIKRVCFLVALLLVGILMSLPEYHNFVETADLNQIAEVMRLPGMPSLKMKILAVSIFILCVVLILAVANHLWINHCESPGIRKVRRYSNKKKNRK